MDSTVGKGLRVLYDLDPATCEFLFLSYKTLESKPTRSFYIQIELVSTVLYISYSSSASTYLPLLHLHKHPCLPLLCICNDSQFVSIYAAIQFCILVKILGRMQSQGTHM